MFGMIIPSNFQINRIPIPSRYHVTYNVVRLSVILFSDWTMVFVLLSDWTMVSVLLSDWLIVSVPALDWKGVEVLLYRRSVVPDK